MIESAWLDTAGRVELANELPDTPVNAIPIGALRTGAAEAYRFGNSALVILSGEGTGFGDAGEILQILRAINGCTCVLLPTPDADTLAGMLATPTRFVDDVQYVLEGLPQGRAIPEVRTVRASAIPAPVRGELFGNTDIDVLDQGLVACAYVNGAAVAQANSLFCSDEYGDIGVKTLPEYRRRGFATAAAFLVASSLCEQGLRPVWSTAVDSGPSRRVAEKLGFSYVSSQRFVVPEGAEWI